MKKLLYLAITFLMTAVMTVPFGTGAVYVDEENGLAVGIRVEVSKNGSEWYNYTGDSEDGGQTLVVSPGDTLTFRGYVWNEGENPVEVDMKAIMTGANYFEDFSPFDTGTDDLDSNGNGYTSETPVVSSENNGTIEFDVGLDDEIATTTTESNPEVGSVSVKIIEGAPDQLLIAGIFELISAARYVTFSNPFIGQAYAQGLEGGISTVRIIVSNPSPATITILPKTGSDQ